MDQKASYIDAVLSLHERLPPSHRSVTWGALLRLTLSVLYLPAPPGMRCRHLDTHFRLLRHDMLAPLLLSAQLVLGRGGVQALAALTTGGRVAARRLADTAAGGAAAAA